MKGNIATKLRSKQTWDSYISRVPNPGCFICGEDNKPIKQFEYWKIIHNQYPYDAVAENHHMLVPFEHVRLEHMLERAAQDELWRVLRAIDINEEYDCIMRNFTVGQSHQAHLHYHLITWIRVV